MTDGLVTELLPTLGRSLGLGFNVFDVMHHGTHEKQLSNVFGWLLDVGGTHDLGDRFLRIFIDEVNSQQSTPAPFPYGDYIVRQEVNTRSVLDEIDIADLVLESSTARLVVENYFTSDGHGHDYERYLAYSMRDGRHGTVILLCRDEDRSRQSDGWEKAVVLTYSRLIERLHSEFDDDATYHRQNPDVHSFIVQMHRKFVTGRGPMAERDVLRFVTTMCDTGEAQRFGWRRQNEAAEQFASDLAVQARERYVEGRELLQRVKRFLRAFAAGPLRDQLDATLGHERVSRVNATYSGIYQWTVNIDMDGTASDSSGAHVQLKFGPTAWFTNEQDPDWQNTVRTEEADYGCVFVTRTDTLMVSQSTVTLQEVLDGLNPGDVRLHDEIIQLLAEAPRPALVLTPEPADDDAQVRHS